MPHLHDPIRIVFPVPVFPEGEPVGVGCLARDDVPERDREEAEERAQVGRNDLGPRDPPSGAP